MIRVVHPGWGSATLEKNKLHLYASHKKFKFCFEKVTELPYLTIRYSPQGWRGWRRPPSRWRRPSGCGPPPASSPRRPPATAPPTNTEHLTSVADLGCFCLILIFFHLGSRIRNTARYSVADPDPVLFWPLHSGSGMGKKSRSGYRIRIWACAMNDLLYSHKG